MKRNALIFALVVLLLLEFYFLTAFLPQSWQERISAQFERVVPGSYDHSRITHPALDKEIEEAFGGKRTYNLIANGLFGTLFVLDGAALALVWRSLKRAYSK